MLRPSQLIRDTPLGQELLDEGRALGAAEGRLEIAQGMLFDLGTEKLGPADPSVADRIERINDIDVLRRLTRQVLTASSWAELLASQADT